MRTVLAAFFGFISVVALLAALPLGWVATHVASEDGYVDFTAELVDDPELRSDLSGVVTEQIIQTSGVSETFAPVVQQALTAGVTRVVDQPEFDTAWRETQRRSHQVVFGDVRDLSPEQDAADRLVIDLGPVAQVVADSVTADLPVSISAPEQVLVPVGGDDQRQLIERVNETKDQSTLAAGTAAVAAGLAILLARRRAGAFAWLGLGAVLVAGLLHLVADRAVPRVIERGADPSGFAGRAQTLLADAALQSFDRWLLIAGGVGAALLVVGLLVQTVAGARSNRGEWA